MLKIKISESELAQHTADSYHEIAMEMANPSDLNVADVMEIKLFELKEITEKLRTEREVLRVELTHTYDKEFPTLEETAGETESAANDTSKKKGDSDSGKGDVGRSRRPFGDAHLDRSQRQASYQGEIPRHGRR